MFYVEYAANSELLVVVIRKKAFHRRRERWANSGRSREREKRRGKGWRGATIIGRRIIAIVFSKQTKHESCRRRERGGVGGQGER